jgi:hypothetical protein
MFETLAVFQLSKFWLNASAPRSICEQTTNKRAPCKGGSDECSIVRQRTENMLETLAVFQPPMFWLNAIAEVGQANIYEQKAQAIECAAQPVLWRQCTQMLLQYVPKQFTAAVQHQHEPRAGRRSAASSGSIRKTSSKLSPCSTCRCSG